MFSIAMAQSEGLSAESILRDLPSDPASIVGYIIMFVFIGLIVYGLRKGGNKPGGTISGA